MKTLRFQNGDQMPAIGLGTWLSPRNEVKQAVIAAVEAGYRHIDCAAIYGNEDVIGEALEELFHRKVVRREDLWITSKLWNDSHKPDEVEVALRKTLLDLHLDYVDLYLVHWPVCLKHGVDKPKNATDFANPLIPIADTWHAMEEMKRKGLTRHIGVSNFNVDRLEKLWNEATLKPELNQVEIHPYFNQQQMVDYCRSKGILLTAFSPLGCGHREKTADHPVMDEREVTLIAARHEVTPAEVILAWGIQRGYAVIPKSVHAERIRTNFQGAMLTLSEEEMATIQALPQYGRLTKGASWTIEGSPYTQENLWGPEL